jgi:hypothetical protein
MQQGPILPNFCTAAKVRFLDVDKITAKTSAQGVECSVTHQQQL